MVNPIPILFRSSRWWLLKSVGDLLISGFHQVEVRVQNALGRIYTDQLSVSLVHRFLDGVCSLIVVFAIKVLC